MVILDLRTVTAFTDYFLLASAAQPEADRGHRRRGAGDAARAEGCAPPHVEGYPRQEWILLDYGAFVVHVFTPRMRTFYDLERLWGGATRIEVAGMSVAAPRVAGQRGGGVGRHARAAASGAAGWPRPGARCCVEGESGTGKDLLAHWLHYKGPRRDGPFIKVHCPSIPEDLLESELFGHEKGAFTDARQAKAGKIELAAGGTLFFDQIEDLSLPLQAKLLRVVEERRFERLGGTRTIEVDVRFVSASTRRPAPGGRSGHVPRGPLPPAERGAAAACRRCASGARTSCRWPSPSCSASASAAPRAPGGSSRRPRTRCAAITGRATCASCARWSSAPRSCAEGERSRRRALPAQVLEQPPTLWAGRERRPSLRGRGAGLHPLRARAGAGAARRGPRPCSGISRKALWEKRRRYGIP